MGYNNFRSWVQEGICGSWDPELFREHAPAVAAAMDDLGETAWKMATIDGKQFTIPGVNGNYAYGCATSTGIRGLKKPVSPFPAPSTI